MAKLNIFTPNMSTRKDTSDEVHYIKDERTTPEVNTGEQGCQIRFLVGDWKACWFGQLMLSWEETEKLGLELEEAVHLHKMRREPPFKVAGTIDFQKIHEEAKAEAERLRKEAVEKAFGEMCLAVGRGLPGQDESEKLMLEIFKDILAEISSLKKRVEELEI